MDRITLRTQFTPVSETDKHVDTSESDLPDVSPVLQLLLLLLQLLQSLQLFNISANTNIRIN